MIKCIEQRPDGICLYEMENDELRVVVTSYGVTLMEIDMKEADGKWQNVILGYPTVEDYMAKSGTYFGALVGRVCNRLAKGEYTLNGKNYTCAINNGPNSLHGGLEGFSYKNFDSKIEGDKLVFTYVSKDGEEGYPGTLTLTCTLELGKDTLNIIYDASSDADTLLNLTQHTYFNLNGMDSDAGDHLMQINALRHGLVDADGLCMGKFREVEGTPLDFRTLAPVKQGFDLNDWNVKTHSASIITLFWKTALPLWFLLIPYPNAKLKWKPHFPVFRFTPETTSIPARDAMAKRMRSIGALRLSRRCFPTPFTTRNIRMSSCAKAKHSIMKSSTASRARTNLHLLKRSKSIK